MCSAGVGEEGAPTPRSIVSGASFLSVRADVYPRRGHGIEIRDAIEPKPRQNAAEPCATESRRVSDAHAGPALQSLPKVATGSRPGPEASQERSPPRWNSP